MPDDDWECPQCGLKVYYWRTACPFCDGELAIGDHREVWGWYCDCGALNGWFRTSCWSCQRLKEVCATLFHDPPESSKRGVKRQGSEERRDAGRPRAKCGPRPPSGSPSAERRISEELGPARGAASKFVGLRNHQIEEVTMFLKHLYSEKSGRNWLKVFWDEPEAEALKEVELACGGDLSEELWGLSQEHLIYMHASMWIGMKHLYGEHVMGQVKELRAEWKSRS